MRVAAVVVISLLLGCAAPKESDRQLNRQNVQIGEMLAKSTDLSIVQVGEDIRDNSITLEKNVLGAPETPVQPYRPEVSKALREESTKDHASTWWKTALAGVGTFILGGGLLRVLSGVAPTIFAGPAGAALSVFTEAVARLRAKAETTPSNSITHQDLLAELVRLGEEKGVRGFMARFADKTEEKLGVKIVTKLEG